MTASRFPSVLRISLSAFVFCKASLQVVRCFRVTECRQRFIVSIQDMALSPAPRPGLSCPTQLLRVLHFSCFLGRYHCSALCATRAGAIHLWNTSGMSSTHTILAASLAWASESLPKRVCYQGYKILERLLL